MGSWANKRTRKWNCRSREDAEVDWGTLCANQIPAHTYITKQSLSWMSQRRQKRRSPRNSWQRSMKEMREAGFKRQRDGEG